MGFRKRGTLTQKAASCSGGIVPDHGGLPFRVLPDDFIDFITKRRNTATQRRDRPDSGLECCPESIRRIARVLFRRRREYELSGHNGCESYV
jgi:hypothetical protein